MNRMDEKLAPKRPGISETTLASAEVKYSDFPEAGSIEIPYWTQEGELSAFSRWRLPNVRANGQKYHQPEGSKVYAYFPPGFFHRNGSENPFGLVPNSVVLVEGEFRALALLELGIYAIGLPSFIVYYNDENEHRRLIRDLQVTLSKEKVGTIYFLGDSDTATNFEFARQAVFLSSAAFPSQVILPRIPFNCPKGIDDCKEAMGTEFDVFFTRLIKTAITLPRKANEAEVALLLFERELDAIKKLAGMERERQFSRIVQLCVSSSRFAKSHATSRLCELAREVLGLSKTDFKNAIKEQSKTGNDPKSPSSSAIDPTAQQNKIEAYYDIARKEYLIQNAAGRWHSYDQGQFKLQLRSRGYPAGKPQDALVSPAELVMLDIQNHSDVAYAGALAGRKAGFYDENGVRLLVTSSPEIMTHNAVRWTLLEKVLRNAIAGPSEPWAEQQWIVFNGWMKIARETLIPGKFQPSQVVAFAGEVDSGKSLIQMLITMALGGRAAKAAMFLQGRTDFNSELFGAEHLMLEDEAASRSHEARSALAAAIKTIAVNQIHQCHGKRRDIVNLCPRWWLTMSLNDEPERMMILPKLSSDIADKIILLRVIRHPMPAPTETADEKAAFWKQLINELPGYLHWLATEFQIPAEWVSNRYGVKEFHHPQLVEALDELSEALVLLELIDQLKPWGEFASEWEGTATELRQELLKDDRTRRDAQRLLDWTNATGQYLGELAKMKPHRVKNARTTSSRDWIIFAP